MRPIKNKTHFPRDQKEYIMAQSTCGIHVGERVCVTKKAKSFSHGWNNTWVSPMNCYIGSVHEVLCISPNGIELSGFGFPYFVLRKV